MVVALVLLIGIVALGVAAVQGWAFDSRDPDFTLRDVFSPHPGDHESRHTDTS